MNESFNKAKKSALCRFGLLKSKFFGLSLNDGEHFVQGEIFGNRIFPAPEQSAILLAK